MTFTLRSSSTIFNETERLTRTRQRATFDRFLSFNENKSSSAENRRRILKSTPNLIELLEEEEDDFDEYQVLSHECSSCSKLFASEYGLNHHMNMYHPNQSVLCSICNLTFRSHRSLKTHQQRRHSSYQTVRLNSSNNARKTNESLPNYSFISSYLVLAFSSRQFPLIAKQACEQTRLPLGSLSSQLYRCHLCQISFPCSRTLKYHHFDQHEQYEYRLCQNLLHEMILQIEETSRTVENHDDDFESIEILLAKQAPHLKLQNKQLMQKTRANKFEQHRLMFPTCQHPARTCANLCLEHLSSYSKLIQNYPYTIPTVPKGSSFTQGSIVSHIPLTVLVNATPSKITETNSAQEMTSARQKRKANKDSDNSSTTSSLIQTRKRMSNPVPMNNVKPKRSTSNHRSSGIKQEHDHNNKNQDIKIIIIEQVSSSTNGSTQKKILPKDNSIRSSSLSSTSSTSTRTSLTKTSSSSTNLIGSTSKRSLSPSVNNSLDRSPSKRRRTREENNKGNRSSSPVVIKILDDDENDIEQENDDDDEIIPLKVEPSTRSRQAKQRQASSGSIEYVQTLDNDQPATPSLNNIENIKSKSKTDDEDIIICRSPPSMTRSTSNDEHVRVRCKVCGRILKGRSRFSQHVIEMHGHLLMKKASAAEQQHRTAIIR